MDWLPSAVKELPDGSWLLARGTSIAAAYPTSTHLARISARGEVQWEKTLSRIGVPSPFIRSEAGASLILCSDESKVIAVSFTEDGALRNLETSIEAKQFLAIPDKDGGAVLLTLDDSSAISLHRLDAALKELWRVALPQARTLPASRSVAVLEDGGVALSLPDFSLSQKSLKLLRFSATGKLLWEQPVITSGQGETILSASPGGMILASTAITRIGSTDLISSKYDLKGKFSWSIQLGGANSEQFKDMRVLADGSALLLGWSSSPASSVGVSWPIGPGFFAAKISPSGKLKKLSGIADGISLSADTGSLSVAAEREIMASLRLPSGELPKQLSLIGLDESLLPKWRVPLESEPLMAHALYPSILGGVLSITQWREANGSSNLRLSKFAREGVTLGDLSPLSFRPGRVPQGAYSLQTRLGWTYRVQASPSMRPDSWTDLLTIIGDGEPFTFPGLLDHSAPQQFFRLRVETP